MNNIEVWNEIFFQRRNQAENLHGIFCDSVGRFENQGRSGAQRGSGERRESGQVREVKWSDTGQYKFTFYKRITSQE